MTMILASQNLWVIVMTDDLIKGLESDIRSGKTKKSRKKEKPTDKGIDMYIYVTYTYESAIRFHNNAKKLRKENKPIDEGSDKKMHNKCSIPRKRQKQKKKSDIRKIKEEDLNIVSINARGVAKKKKSIEEILNNESVDIAIISELSVKTLLGLKGYREFIEIRGHMHGICILVRNDIALRIHNPNLQTN